MRVSLLTVYSTDSYEQCLPYCVCTVTFYLRCHVSHGTVWLHMSLVYSITYSEQVSILCPKFILLFISCKSRKVKLTPIAPGYLDTTNNIQLAVATLLFACTKFKWVLAFGFSDYYLALSQLVSLVPRPSSLTGIVSHEEKVKYRMGGKEEEEEEKISERKAW